jgi:hypothetical protein
MAVGACRARSPTSISRASPGSRWLDRGSGSPTGGRGWWVLAALAVGLVWPQGVEAATARAYRFRQVTQVADSSFRHDRHEDFTCLDCHSMGAGHGALRVRDVTDCRGCHHVTERANRPCSHCHEPEELGAIVYQRERVLPLSVADAPVRRRIDFSHAIHEEVECTACHADGPSLAVPDLDCGTCHEEHHVDTRSECMTCHRPAPPGAHPLEVHETCSGSGCHVDPPFEVPPRTRVACLWCHEDKADHHPEEASCVACHFLEARGGSLELTGASR